MRMKKSGSMMPNKRILASLTIVTAVGAALTAVVLATPPSGVVTSIVLARARFLDAVDIKLKVGDRRKEVIHVPDAQDTVLQQMVLAPGGQSGWHSHPGPVVVLVKSGTVSFYSRESTGCGPQRYSAGEAFIDSGQGHVHLLVNEGSQNVEFWAMFFDVPPAGGAFRLDAANPGGGCPF
jgi:quercetin dioxygenase-like cupin family protein